MGQRDPGRNLEEHNDQGEEDGGDARLRELTEPNQEASGGQDCTDDKRGRDGDSVPLGQREGSEGTNQEAEARPPPAGGVPVALAQAQSSCRRQEGDGVRQRNTARSRVLTGHHEGRRGHEQRRDDADGAGDEVVPSDGFGIQGGEGVRGRGRQEEGGNEDEAGGRQRGKSASILTCPRSGHSFDDLTDRFREVVVDHVGDALTQRLERERRAGAHSLGGQGLGLIEQTTRGRAHCKAVIRWLISESAHRFNHSREQLHQGDRLRKRHVTTVNAVRDRERNQRHSS